MTEKRFTFHISEYDEVVITKENEGREFFIGNEEDINIDYIIGLVDLLNEQYEENKKLRTLNYVNKEAVRLNNIKTVKIGKEDVDCTNINWELLYELYNGMIDFYYDESGDFE